MSQWPLTRFGNIVVLIILPPLLTLLTYLLLR